MNKMGCIELCKRFQVLDLFHENKPIHVDEWIPVQKRFPHGENGIYKVKRSNGNEIMAYYCKDRLWNLCKYSIVNTAPSEWWDKETKKPIHDVTHWGKNNE